MAARKTSKASPPRAARGRSTPARTAPGRKSGPRRAAPAAAAAAAQAAKAPEPPAAAGPQVIPPEIEAELRMAAAETAPAAGGGPGAGAIASVLLEIAALLELTGANTFKVRAYENAARALAGLGLDLDVLLREDRLGEVRGVGSSIAEKIVELATTGRLRYHEELRAQLPPGLLEMLRIPGLGPKRVKALWDELGIATLDDLERACQDGRLAALRGFGDKTAHNVALGIEQRRHVQGTYLWAHAYALVAPIVETLRRHPAVHRIEIAGSLRRRKETVHDVDILIGTDAAADVMQVFAGGPWSGRVLGSGDTKTSVVHPDGIQIDLRAVTDAQFPYALHHFTGSKEHNIAMRGRALRLGIKMNEYGLFRGEELIRCRDEAEVFAAVGLEFVPPELREDRGEIEAAASGGLPRRLLEPADLQGAFHVHSDWSDGRASLADLAQAARALGWKYLGIADHSRAAAWAHGLDPARLAAQRRDLDGLQRRMRGLRLLCGIECEVLPDGRLDYDDETLRGFDFVVAAVHGGFKLSRDEQTRRILRAIEHPSTQILAHPTGRILLQRPGYEVDLPAVLEAAARHGVALEINAAPQRLDLDGGWAKQARDKGAVLAVNPDAHAVEGLENVRYGVAMARRGWLEPQHVVNAWPLEEVEAHWTRRRSQAGPRP